MDVYKLLLACSLMVSAVISAPAQSLSTQCGDKPAEIFFLLDSSSSIWSPDFKKQLRFVTDVVDVFDIGPNRTRVGVSSFSYHYHENIALDTFDTKEQVKEAVKAIPQYLGGTYTYDALDGVRTRGLSQEVVRPGVARILIVLTDGQSYNTEKTKIAAKKLKDDGITVFAVGIGQQADLEELAMIASEPKDKYMFHVGNYAMLETIKESLAIKACTAEDQKDAASAPMCGRNNPADVMFLVDPTEVGAAHTAQIYEFIGSLLPEFNMKNDNMRVGLESRNCGADNINLGQYVTEEELTKAIRSTDVSKMHHMLKRLRTHAYLEENGGRDSARHMAVVFVDDRLYDPKAVLDEARRTKFYDVELFVVAIGDSTVEDELLTLCSSPTDRHFMRVESYDDLLSMKPTFLKNFCHGL